MTNKEELQRQADHHDHEARGADEMKRKFETGDYLGAGHTADHDEWVKGMIATLPALEANHLALRDKFHEMIHELASGKLR